MRAPQVALIALAALSVRLPTGEIVITCMRFTVLVGLIYSALNAVGEAPEPLSPGIEEAFEQARIKSIPKVALPPNVANMGILEEQVSESKGQVADASEAKEEDKGE